MLIKACLNGGTTRQQHPSVPRTPDELAADARDAVRAGAGAVHAHPRDASGDETLEPEPVLAAVHRPEPGRHAHRDLRNRGPDGPDSRQHQARLERLAG